MLSPKSDAKVEVLGHRKREHCTPFLFGKNCYTCEKKAVLLRDFFNSKSMKMYELIYDLKKLGYWKPLLCKECMRTLDRYYAIYELILRYEPERKYGYLRRLFKREDFAALIPKDRYGAFRWDSSTIKWIIREMEQEV